jgi:hypothetical protein
MVGQHARPDGDLFDLAHEVSGCLAVVGFRADKQRLRVGHENTTRRFAGHSTAIAKNCDPLSDRPSNIDWKPGSTSAIPWLADNARAPSNSRPRELPANKQVSMVHWLALALTADKESFWPDRISIPSRGSLIGP